MGHQSSYQSWIDPPRMEARDLVALKGRGAGLERCSLDEVPERAMVFWRFRTCRQADFLAILYAQDGCIMTSTSTADAHSMDPLAGGHMVARVIFQSGTTL